MSIPACRMIQEEFIKILFDWAKLSIDLDGGDYPSPWTGKEGYDDLDGYIGNALIAGYNVVNSIVLDDLAKINFSWENFGSQFDPYFPNDPLGMWITSDGIPVLGCCAYGDWEKPVFFVLYPGKDNIVRAYMPKSGNTWNIKTKSAYGNNPDIEGYDETNWPNADATLFKIEVDKTLESIQ